MLYGPKSVCLVMVSTLSSITLNFAIAAPYTRALRSGQGELYRLCGQYQGVELYARAEPNKRSY